MQGDAESLPPESGKESGDSPAWDDVLFVIRSRHRRTVLGALLQGPRSTKALSEATALRMPHVSRALRQLESRDLLDRIPVEGSAIGWYRPTARGERTWLAAARHQGETAWVPMVRGTHAASYARWVRDHKGAKAARDVLRGAGLDAEPVDPDAWYPFGPTTALLEGIERRFGDGTYALIRRIAREVVPSCPSVARVLARGLPPELVAELMPGAYHREFNCGRLEVDAKPGRAELRFYEWVSTPARCAAIEGAAEGVLDAQGLKGTVRKIACVREGDQYCGYDVRWE